MNNKITFPRLASMLADKSGRTKRFSEDFLREFFSLISETLENGDTVKIKGLGTFRLSRVEPRKSVDVTTGEPMEISGHTKVVFVPAKEIAEAVNAPFEAFAAMEIPDGIDIPESDTDVEEDMTAISESTEISEISQSTENFENTEISENSERSEDTEIFKSSEIPEDSENSEISEVSESPESPEDSEISEDFENSEYSEYSDNSEYPHISGRRHWLKGFLSGIGAAIAVIAVAMGCWLYFARPDLNGSHTDSETEIMEQPLVDTDTIKEPDTIVINEDVITDRETESIDKEKPADNMEVPTAPSDNVVYDTIGKTRYLTTMAKVHYGNYNLWPYIYEENKAFLRHPDRIRPGTPVVVPKLSKYGVDPTNPKDIETAKKLGVEIYARYKKE